MSDLIPNLDYSLSSLELLEEQGVKEQFLRFQLEPDTKVMLPIGQVTEVLQIPVGQIVPIPQMPPWVMGVYNWRGEILWMIDLGQLIGLSSWYEQGTNTANYTGVVLSGGTEDFSESAQEKISLGLIITRVEDIEWCDPAQIQSPPATAVTSELAPFLRGYWLKADEDIILTLDGEALIAAMPKF